MVEIGFRYIKSDRKKNALNSTLCNTATQSGIWHCYQNQFDEKTDLNSFLQRSTMILHFRQNVIEHNVSLTATAINYHFYSAPALQKSIIFCNEPIIKVAQCGKTRNSLIDKIIRQINSLRISLVLKTKNVAFTKKFLDNFVSNFP